MTKAATLLAIGVVLIGAVMFGVVMRRGEPCDSAAALVLLQSPTSAGSVGPRWSGRCFAISPTARTAGSESPIQLRGALARFELAGRIRSPQTELDLGVALALAGDPTAGIHTIGASLGDRNADALSNLAAAHLLRARRDGSAYDRVVALDLSGRALSVQPRHAAALFNQALALSDLGLAEAADRTWRQYLTADSWSFWANEGRRVLSDPQRNVASVSSRLNDLIARRPEAPELPGVCAEAGQACRDWVQRVALPGWARAFLSGDAVAAAASIQRARGLVHALTDRGDRLEADTVADIEFAITADAGRASAIASGIDAYARGRDAFERELPSATLFSEAERILANAYSPFVGWAHAQRVYADLNRYTAVDLERIGPELRGWARDANARGYHALEGRLLYLAALSHGNRADYTSAEPLLAASHAALERTREHDHLAATQVALADARLRLGDPEAGWQWAARAFAILPEILSTRRRYVILLTSGVWLVNSQLDHAALTLLAGARDSAVQSRVPARLAEVSIYLAKAFRRLGFMDRARAELAAAGPDPSRTIGWGQDDRSRHEYLSAFAEVEALDKPDEAIAAATEALRFFESRGFAVRVATLHLVRGRAHQVRGQRDLAAADYDAGIATYERYRGALASSQLRLMSQDVVWQLYEARLGVADGTAADILAVAERGRARTLLEEVRPQGIAFSPERLQAGLPRHVRVVMYAVLEKELLTWAITPDQIELRRQAIDRAVLERQVLAFVHGQSTAGPPDSSNEQAEALYRLLVTPVADVLAENTALLFVPDDVLHRLPFGALRAPGSRRRIIDSHDVVIAPSATLIADWLDEPVAVSKRLERLLVVANPAGGVGGSPLPGAEREAASIAPLYADAEVLSRSDATKAAFVQRIATADVIHFAGHATSSSDFPLLSHLEFATEAGLSGTAAMDADEIAALPLTRTRLVVLAACRTGGGAIRSGEGVLSLARPFLIAGVPVVIATLWEIDDALSRPLVTQLHALLAAGVAPARALRRAQLESEVPPAVWSAFVVVGNSGWREPPPKESGL